MNDLEPRYRGSANPANSFMRSLGRTLGVTIFGTIQTNVLTNRLADAFNGMKGAQSQVGDPQAIFLEGVRSQILK